MTQSLRHQTGFTLVEVVGVVTMTSALMLVAVSLLHSVLSWNRNTTAAATQTVSFNRMEQQLRNQLRNASGASVEGRVLTIESGDSRSQWTLADDRCEVETKGGDDGPRYEKYDIGPRDPWKLSLQNGLAEIELALPEGQRGLPFRLVVASNSSPEKPE